MCTQVKKGSEGENGKDRYREAYKELLQKDPIASMDETTMEYPSHDYRQIDNMIEERKRFREGTPKRDLCKEKYQPRRLVDQRKIDLNLPKTAWTPHRDSAPHKIYPIPEDEEERGSSSQQQTNALQSNASTGRRTSRTTGEPTEVKVLEVVLELQEEGEEEMVQVTPVEMKDQTGTEVLTLMRKKMKVVSIQPD